LRVSFFGNVITWRLHGLGDFGKHPAGTAAARGVGFVGGRGVGGYGRDLARRLLLLGQENEEMNTLANSMFWSMKVKIAILTLATFAALC